MTRFRIAPEAEEELAAAAEWYEARRAGLGVFFTADHEAVTVVAIAHARRRPGYWLTRIPAGQR